ncbi:MAG: DMT family transporter [Parachlamydiaceae bacterium]|nr:DMT family transporter [Parachlamydiaceae bacterium]
MYKGILFALGACFIWGLIFVVPQFMTGFSSIEVALGRYLFFGIISLCILFKDKLLGTCNYSISIWIKALYYSLITTIIYYTCLVLALRYSTPAICALVCGISPITIAFYGNWKQRECSYKSLIIPSILILVGLVIINAPQLMKVESPLEYGMGLICCFIALTAWSWYVVANSHLLRENPHLISSDWSTLLGVSTLFWVGFFGIFLAVFFSEKIDMQKYYTLDSALTNFLIGCSILGLVCSWLGSYLWNRASHYLPVSLAGQLTIFETIFGLSFVYTLEQRMPPQMECVGISLLLGAVIYGIRSSSHAAPQHA